MPRIRQNPLPQESRHLIYEQIARLRDQKRESMRKYDDEIDRLECMLDTNMVPQSCGG